MRRLLTLAMLIAATTAGTARSGDAPPIQTQQFRPQWQVGDRWTIETESQQQQTAAENPTRSKAQWRFQVEAVEPIAGQDCFRITARPIQAEEPKTVIWIDRNTLAIKQIQTQLPTPRGYKTVTESYQSATAAPVVGPITVLPIALPQFPEPGLKSVDAYQYETISGPGGVKAVGDVGFSVDIRQSFSKPSTDRIKSLFDDQDTKDLQNRPVIEVQLVTPDLTVRQLWANDAPWPMFTDNGLTQARLIQTDGSDRSADERRGEPQEPDGGSAGASPSDDDGIKNLETADGLERGIAAFTPWSGYWWPIREGRLLIPLGKYDRLTGHTAAVWEKKHNPPGPNVPQWHGYCHAWSAASVLEDEPAKMRVVHASRVRVGLDVGDQKGLLTSCHTQDLANSWGDRFGDGDGSEDPQDLRPDQLWRLLKLHLGQQGVPLVLDVEAGEEVWNYPIYQYEIRYQPTRGGQCKANLTLLMADDAVPPTYQGTKVRKQTYQFTVKMRGSSVVSGSGQWIGRSKQDHPDFAWYPFTAVATNPEVVHAKVKKLVTADQEEPATEPDTQPTNTDTQPSNTDTQPSNTDTQPTNTDTQPSDTSTQPTQPANGSSDSTVERPRPAGRPIVLSPMELVALIANKTPSFEFDVMLDRFDGASYRPGETFFVRVKSEKAGYLSLLQVDSTGTPALLYPTCGEDNRIVAGKLIEIRPRGAAGGFPVIGPAGVVRVKAVATSRPLAFTGSLEEFQSQTPRQSQAPNQRQSGRQDASKGKQAAAASKPTQVQPVQFRLHPTQRQQVQKLLSQKDPQADAAQLGCQKPEEILGPFAQDMTTYYVDTAAVAPAGKKRVSSGKRRSQKTSAKQR